MEKQIKLPNDLCQRIFNHQFELDIGNVSEEMITKTIELYVEAISIYTTYLAENIDNLTLDKLSVARKNQYYQDKIKKLLMRNDVQKCLVGKKNNPKGFDLQKSISKVSENAPEQAKLLIQHFKEHHKQQEILIRKSLEEQTNSLNDRIARRSKSKKKKDSFEQRSQSIFAQL